MATIYAVGGGVLVLLGLIVAVYIAGRRAGATAAQAEPQPQPRRSSIASSRIPLCPAILLLSLSACAATGSKPVCQPVPAYTESRVKFIHCKFCFVAMRHRIAVRKTS
jgi:hypothetical protein